MLRHDATPDPNSHSCRAFQPRHFSPVTESVLLNMTAARLSPEVEMLLLCSRVDLSPQSSERIRKLAAQPLDWLRLIASAGDHRVMPLVYRSLEAVCAEAIPALWGGVLEASVPQTALRNLLLSSELVRILDCFEAAGFTGFPYKGPVCAVAYGNIALRQFGDLDIFVPHRHIRAACDLLHQMEYDSEVKNFSPGVGDAAPGQYLFWREQSRYLIELHSERTLRYFPVPLVAQEIEARARPVRLGGREVLTFSPEDNLIFLCVHGAKHFWDRLLWIVDIAEISERTNVDWQQMFARARAMQCHRMTVLGLALGQQLLGARLPEPAAREVANCTRLGPLIQEVVTVLLSDVRVWPRATSRLLFRIRAHDKPVAGLKQALRLATRPTEEDWSLVRLPKWLFPLYTIVRPFHLARKYGWGFGARPIPDLAPFVPTPDLIVDRMLEMAELEPGDVLYDLGCGDGRIVARAAEDYGVHCVGVDIDPVRIAEATKRIRTAGLGHLVTLVQQDVKTFDISPATAVTIYLTVPGNLKIWQKLESELRPGARVVSRDFEMPGWKVEKYEELEVPGTPGTTLLMWRMVGPAPRS
jgi:hypothetical protein